MTEALANYLQQLPPNRIREWIRKMTELAKAAKVDISECMQSAHAIMIAQKHSVSNHSPPNTPPHQQLQNFNYTNNSPKQALTVIHGMPYWYRYKKTGEQFDYRSLPSDFELSPDLWNAPERLFHIKQFGLPRPILINTETHHVVPPSE